MKIFDAPEQDVVPAGLQSVKLRRNQNRPEWVHRTVRWV